MASKQFPFVVMVLCFVYGGIALLLFAQQALSGTYFNPSRLALLERNATPGQGLLAPRGDSLGPYGGSLAGPSEFGAERVRRFESRFRIVSIIAQFFTLSGAIISIFAGSCLLYLLYAKQMADVEKDLIGTLTTEDEKMVLHRLEQSGGELTQSELVKHTGLSRVKVHRILNRLEHLSIIRKFPFGMTNKIRLEKKLERQKGK